MKINLYKDEKYPVYYVSDVEHFSFGNVVDWPVNLDYKIFREVEREYSLWQQILADYYKQVVKEDNGPWSITNSPSATTTSSTPTS